MGKGHKENTDKKEPPSSGSQPQTRKSSVSKDVNITKYLDSRAAELAHFESVLQNKFKESTRTPMQTVPKHMRRRAMSHNRFRIPSRIRALNAKYMKDSEKKILRNRKHARNSRLILLHFFKRSFRASMQGKPADQTNTIENELQVDDQLGLPKFLRCKWLETHLWHARRMSMMEYCGCKIAQFSRQKAMKRSRVGALAGVSAYDHSYLSALEISGLPQPQEFISRFCTQIKRGAWENGVIEILVDPRIGQATIIRSADHSLVCLVDPAVEEELSQKIEALIPSGSSIKMQVLNDLLNVFELFGPQSLRALIRSMKDDVIGLPQREAGYDGLSLVPTQLKFGFVGGLNAQYHKTGTIRDITNKTSEGVAGQEMIDEDELRTTSIDDWSLEENLQFGGWLRSQTTLDEFWSRAKQETEMDNIMARFFESRRGQYSHKRTKFNPEAVPDPAATPKQAKSPIKSKSAPRAVESANQEGKFDQGDLKKRLAELKQKQFQIVIVNLSQRSQQLNKVLVLVPSGFGLRLWRRLNQFGARALGLREYLHVGHQLHQRVYPVDYPESLQSQRYEVELQSKLQDKYFRRPPAKRTNHLKINSPFPFSLNFELLSRNYEKQHLVHCQIHSLHSGVPKDRGYICFPLESDLQQLLKSFELHKNSPFVNLLDKILNENEAKILEPVGTIDDESQLKPNPHRNRTKYLDLIKLRGFQGPSRDIIGRITSGFLDNKSAKGFGFASVFDGELDKLAQITATLRSLSSARHLRLPDDSCLALFRNTDSVHYFYCLLTRDG